MFSAQWTRSVQKNLPVCSVANVGLIPIRDQQTASALGDPLHRATVRSDSIQPGARKLTCCWKVGARVGSGADARGIKR